MHWKSANAQLLLDDIRVLPEENKVPAKAFDGLITNMKALFTALRDMLLAFFGTNTVC